jgi:hypothetical protein
MPFGCDGLHSLRLAERVEVHQVIVRKGGQPVHGHGDGLAEVEFVSHPTALRGAMNNVPCWA